MTANKNAKSTTTADAALSQSADVLWPAKPLTPTTLKVALEPFEIAFLDILNKNKVLTLNIIVNVLVSAVESVVYNLAIRFFKE